MTVNEAESRRAGYPVVTRWAEVSGSFPVPYRRRGRAFSSVGEDVRALLGLSSADILQDAEVFFARLHPADASAVRSLPDALPAGGRRSRDIRVRVGLDDDWRLLRDQCLVTASGELEGWWIDITDTARGSDVGLDGAPGLHDAIVRAQAALIAGESIDLTVSALADTARRLPTAAEADPSAREALERFSRTAGQERARRHAEASLRWSEARFRAVIEAALDPVIAIDERGLIQSFNRAAEQLFGWPASEILGKNVSILTPTPIRERHDEYLARYVETGERRILGLGREVEGEARDGTRIALELSLAEGWAEGTRFFVGVLRDIRERKAAEARLLEQHTQNVRLRLLLEARTRELSESERRFRGVLEGLPAAALMLDRDGRVTFCNRHLADLLGDTPEALLAQDYFERCVPTRLRQEVRSVFLPTLRGEPGCDDDHEIPIRTPLGGERLIAWRTTLLRSSSGEFVGVAAVGQDVTEERRRARTQEALRRVAELLQDRVRGAVEVLRDVAAALACAADPAARVAVGLRVGLLRVATVGSGAATLGHRVYQRPGTPAVEVTFDQGADSAPIDVDPELVEAVVSSIRLYHERREAEHALRVVDAAVDAAVMPVAFADFATGRLTRVNGACLALWGLHRAEEAVGRPLSEFWADPEHVLGVMNQLTKAGSWSGELVARRADDARRVVRVAASVVRDPSGAPVALMATFDDVTELRLVQSRHVEAQRIAHLGHWVWDIPGGGLTWSDEVYRIFGRTPSAFVATYDAFLAVVHPDDRGPLEQAVARTLRDRVPYDITHRIVLPGGEVRFVREQAEVTFVEDQATRMMGTVLDVTDLRRTEEELRERTELLRTVIEGAPVVICATDPAGVYTLSEGAGLSILGRRPGELVGRSAFEVYADNPAIIDGLRCALAGQTAHRTVRVGDVVFDAVYGPRRDAAGRVVGAIGVAFDQTERVALEEQLRHAQKLEAIGRLAGGIAHDFNNLLTVILCAAEFLAEALAPADPRHADVEQIAGAARRGEALTRQFLTFSRRQVVTPVVRDVGDIVTGMEGLLRRLIGEDIVLRLERDPGPARVCMDPTQLEQALVNLVVNGRDAMPRGGVVTVLTGSTSSIPGRMSGLPPGRYATVAVRDTGHGIPEDVRSRIFEPFFTTKAPGEGTGLGLAMVWGIVAQAGGTVTVESHPGQGAVFTLFLPLHEGAETPPRERAAPQRVSPSNPRRTVLVIEDERGPREMARRCLAGAGYCVLVAESGEEAVAVLEREAVDLVLADVVMPGLSGREVADRIRETHPKLPVLFMTGYTDDTALRYGVAAQAVRLLPKPFTPATIMAAVAEALTGSP